jgi:hypothetical protein
MYLSFFSAHRFFRHAGMDVTMAQVMWCMEPRDMNVRGSESAKTGGGRHAIGSTSGREYEGSYSENGNVK